MAFLSLVLFYCKNILLTLFQMFQIDIYQCYDPTSKPVCICKVTIQFNTLVYLSLPDFLCLLCSFRSLRLHFDVTNPALKLTETCVLTSCRQCTVQVHVLTRPFLLITHNFCFHTRFPSGQFELIANV